jgi:hypothetical protein
MGDRKSILSASFTIEFAHMLKSRIDFEPQDISAGGMTVRPRSCRRRSSIPTSWWTSY